jgi:hypothetical protein
MSDGGTSGGPRGPSRARTRGPGPDRPAVTPGGREISIDSNPIRETDQWQ